MYKLEGDWSLRKKLIFWAIVIAVGIGVAFIPSHNSTEDHFVSITTCYEQYWDSYQAGYYDGYRDWHEGGWDCCYYKWYDTNCFYKGYEDGYEDAKNGKSYDANRYKPDW